MSNPKECKYCRTTANGDDEPCLSLSAAHECPWMSKSNWDALDIRSKRDDVARAIFSECAEIALEQRCERGTPWDLACVTIAEAIRTRASNRKTMNAIADKDSTK